MSFWLRLTHAVGILTLFLMLWSGLLIYWAYDPYEIKVGGIVLLHFFPKWFYGLTNAEHRLATGMGWHFAVQWFFILNGLGYTVWLFTSGHWRDVVPTRRRELLDALKVTGHDLHIVKTLPPQGRYNAAQKFSYAALPVLGMLATLSGWAIYKPAQLGWALALFGSYETARLVHFIVALLFTGFILVHVAQVLRQAFQTGWAHLGAMFLGTPDPEAHEVILPEPLPPLADEGPAQPAPTV